MNNDLKRPKKAKGYGVSTQANAYKEANMHGRHNEKITSEKFQDSARRE
jgi:hypothetical protein